MSLPRIVDREEWTAARTELLEAEKELTRPGSRIHRRSYYFLDLTALGRQEDWEEPKGRSDSVRSGDPDFAS